MSIKYVRRIELNQIRFRGLIHIEWKRDFTNNLNRLCNIDFDFILTNVWP